MKQSAKIFTAAAFFILLGTAAAVGIYCSGLYVYGTGTMDYFSKSNLVYDAVLHGNIYPLWDRNWFNGVQPLRYTAPLPVYILTVCRLFTGGNVTYTYLLFLGLTIFAGGMIWFLIGNAHGRSLVGTCLGVSWLLLPCSLHTLLTEGDLGKMLALLILPVLFDAVLVYYDSGRIRCLACVMACFALLPLCSISLAVITMIGTVILFLFCLVVYRKLHRTFHLAAGMVLGSMWIGVWLVPALSRVYVQRYMLQEMKKYFTELSAAFNPIACLSPYFEKGTYLGLSILLLSIFGILFARKRSMPGFCMGLCMLLSTSSVFFPFFMSLPFASQMGMLRYVPVAATVIMVSFLLWDSLKKPFAVIVCIVLLLDAVPGIYSYREAVKTNMAERYEKDYLLEEAKTITKQRLLLLDSGDTGSVAGFILSAGEDGIPVTTGHGWADTAIASNYMQLNEALDGRYYTYIFDRAIELGNDSVLIKTEDFSQEELVKIDMAAEKLGYHMIKANKLCRLYHMDAPAQFGVVSRYSAIGIGSAARRVSLDFPAMEETKEINLNEYTFEELSQYKLIYLDGFTYTDKYLAERLIQRLAENGVRIVIAADGMPIDEKTSVRNFLGATCSDVKFSNGFPELDTIEGLLYPELFPEEYRNWKTVYLNGLKDSWGSFQMDEHRLDFYGTVNHDNIVMIGLNLTYYYGLTRDEAIGSLLSHAMDLAGAELPQRKIVPIEVTSERNMVQIDAFEDSVNTTLAYHDIFKSAQKIEDRNNLTYVNRGRTVIRFSYPYMWEGIIVSVMGLFFSVILCHILWITKTRRMIHEAALSGVGYPAAGDLVKINGQITLPAHVSYVIESIGWYDAAGRELKEGERFQPGKNSIRIVLRTLGYAKFDENIKVNLDENPAEQKIVEQNKEKLSIEQSYEMLAVYIFEKQPRSVASREEEPLCVYWKLAMEAKLGYLQKYNGADEDWQICGVIEHKRGETLSYTFSYEGVDKTVYRLLYILGNGSTAYSSEFTVTWHAESESIMPSEPEKAEPESIMPSEPEKAEPESIMPSEPEKAEPENIIVSEPQRTPAEEIQEWTSVKDDYDYVCDSEDEDSWYEALSKKNEERFQNGELKEIPWEIPD